MRVILLLFSIGISLHLIGQDQMPARNQQAYDCERITGEAIGKLVNSLSADDLDGLDNELSHWTKQCGITECSQRLAILRDMLENRSSEKTIQDYFINGFESQFRDRVESSQDANYDYIYFQDKSRFGYVPLNHPIDSIVLRKSLDLLNNPRLTSDERLVCLMFTGDFAAFYGKIDGDEYKSGFIPGYLSQDRHEDAKDRGAIVLYSGIYRPIGIRRIFGTSPIIGVAFSSPLSNQFIWELSLKVRINFGDKDFQYYAKGDVNTVNSNMSLAAGLSCGYKLLESKNMIVVPKLGIGVEMVDTGLSSEYENSSQYEPFNVTTMNLSFGLTTLIPVFRSRYIGVGINYHYCPYQWDTNLRTKFDTSAFSTEISWRF